ESERPLGPGVATGTAGSLTGVATRTLVTPPLERAQQGVLVGQSWLPAETLACLVGADVRVGAQLVDQSVVHRREPGPLEQQQRRYRGTGRDRDDPPPVSCGVQDR